jgi:DNA-binding MarR family transcriptional regulator
MDRSIHLLEALIPLIKSFQDQRSSGDLMDFLRYGLAVEHAKESTEQCSDSAIGLMQGYQNAGAQLAFHVHRLHKYTKYYIKEAFKGHSILNADEFSFLVAILEEGPMNKSALIAFNVHEYPSGMEVIKRLIQKGLLLEKMDPEDRRNKIIHATEQGKNVFIQCAVEMSKVSKVMQADLTLEELTSLNAVLARLDHFHERIYKDGDSFSPDNVLSRHFDHPGSDT